MPNMGNNEEKKSSKSEKSESPTITTSNATTGQTNIHVYPDWAAMQAYYGPRVAIPPYYGSPVPSGHASHAYMWAAQPMMPPYGSPYAAVYPHGGMYGHPALPLGPHPHATGVSSSAVAAAPVGVETPTKSTANNDRGFRRKLKEFDGLAMSIGHADGTSENVVGTEKRVSQSSETETSTNHSNGNTSRERKRSREGSPAQGGSVKFESQAGSVALAEANGSLNKALVPTVASAFSDGKSAGVLPVTPGMNMTLELRSPSSANDTKGTVSSVSHPQSGIALPPKGWLQNERELKRERRKQSNRESARRSRLRKQAETEVLARKVELLTDENVALKLEMNQLEEKSQKLRLENTALKERLKNGPSGGKQKIMLSRADAKKTEVTTENLLSRVDNTAPADRGSVAEEVELYQRKPNSGGKLHQLLDASPRTDAVAAG